MAPDYNDVQATPTPAPIRPRVQIVVSRAAEPQHTQPEIPLEPKPVWPEQLTEEEMRDVLTRAGWPEELQHQVLSVAWCESRWRPSAIGDGGRALGLLQIHGPGVGWGGGDGWWTASGVGLDNWNDPVENARVALYAYSRSGWQPWTCKPH